MGAWTIVKAEVKSEVGIWEAGGWDIGAKRMGYGRLEPMIWSGKYYRSSFGDGIWEAGGWDIGA